MTTDLQDFETLLKTVYADGTLTNVEFQQVRDAADASFDELRRRCPEVIQLTEFQQAADVLVQCMQKGILLLKKRKLSSEEKELVICAYGAQVAYIKANFDRFTQVL
jgi:hypothetical protein